MLGVEVGGRQGHVRWGPKRRGSGVDWEQKCYTIKTDVEVKRASGMVQGSRMCPLVVQRREKEIDCNPVPQSNFPRAWDEGGCERSRLFSTEEGSIISSSSR